jgi:hypothetical protein
MRRTISSASFVAVLAMWPALCRMQEPIRVTPCDLVNAPERYSGKVVQVHARVNLAFEDFSLAQTGCEDKFPWVWIMYGGDEPTPTASTVNDHSRKPNSVVKVNGRPIPQVHDAPLTLFKQRLDAIRITPVGNQPCYDCYLYEVTATLTGVFFAVTRREQSITGYGHLGCCHLLAIEQVSDVSFERTPIPMGGSFKCVETKRELSGIEAEMLRVMDLPSGEMNYEKWHRQELVQLTAAASLMGESIGTDEGMIGGRGISGKNTTQEWTSNNRLKKYTLTIESGDPQSETGKATGGSITKTVCTAVVPPLPMTAVANCRELTSDLHVRRDEAKKIASQVSRGKEVWRIGPPEHAAAEALNQAAKTWGIALEEITVAECGTPGEYDGEQVTSCGWSDKTGMESLDVQITRFGYPRNGRDWDSIPWVVTGESGIVCKVEN